MQNKLALITGASSGFGLGLTKGLLLEGWTVIATLRNPDKRMELFAHELKTYGDNLKILELDVTQKAHIDQIVEYFNENNLQGLDCLINNAGYGQFGASESHRDEDLRAIFDVNYFGAVNLTNRLLPFLRESKGHIVVLSSVFGFMGFPLTSSYCASKFALEGHFESLKMEMTPHNVNVTIVQPGGHATDFMKNAHWLYSEKDAYKTQETGYQNLQKKAQTRGGTSEDKAISSIIKSIKSKKPPYRLICGPDANASHKMLTLLGRKTFVRAIGKIINGFFKKEAAKEGEAP